MKLTKHLSLAGVTLVLAAFAAPAQTAVSPATVKGTVIVPERPTAVDANIPAVTGLVRPTGPELSPQVRARVERFKLDARSYLAQQQALKKQLQGANDAERAAVREKLRQLREQWLEQARELRQEQKDRSAVLEKKLPEHKELIDEMRNNAKEQMRNATDSTRRPTD